MGKTNKKKPLPMNEPQNPPTAKIIRFNIKRSFFYLDQVLKFLVLLQQQLVVTDSVVVAATKDAVFFFHPLSIFT